MHFTMRHNETHITLLCCSAPLSRRPICQDARHLVEVGSFGRRTLWQLAPQHLQGGPSKARAFQTIERSCQGEVEFDPFGICSSNSCNILRQEHSTNAACSCCMGWPDPRSALVKQTCQSVLVENLSFSFPFGSCCC